MGNIPDKVDINYKLINELFKIVGVKHSIPPTDTELQQLILKVKETITALENKDYKELETIRNLFSLDKVETNKVNKQKTSILVVDDLVMVTYQLSILLSKIGYQVSLARSAPEGISIFRSSSFKYVLMDLHLPEKEDGYYLLHSIKDKIDMENLDTKIIVMSGIAEASSVEYCLTHGATSFVEKNEDCKIEIINRINKIC
ncbi:MAG: response regulator [Vampirovibrionia bacterium]